MRAQGKTEIGPTQIRRDDELADLRFCALVGAEKWAQLPAAVRTRFSKRLIPGRSVTYAGVVISCQMRAFGWLLAQLGRVIGAPLPIGCETGVAAVVTVTEDAPSGGQVWTRIYARHRGFPQVIHSAKRFAGPTGLEEYLGCGLGIALDVGACDHAISFLSNHYFLVVAGRRLRLPRWIGPGRLKIEHIDRGDGNFDFVLSLRHPLFGELIHQLCRFRDQPFKGEVR